MNNTLTSSTRFLMVRMGSSASLLVSAGTTEALPEFTAIVEVAMT